MAVEKETIGQRLIRLRTELARVEATIDRHEKNGGSWSIGGSSVTEISYNRALKRKRDLRDDILRLENRLNGTSRRSGIAQTKTSME